MRCASQVRCITPPPPFPRHSLLDVHATNSERVDHALSKIYANTSIKASWPIAMLLGTTR
eukprot:scaffold18515_cov28-Tisochrysis_lutea.AAC.2